MVNSDVDCIAEGGAVDGGASIVDSLDKKINAFFGLDALSYKSKTSCVILCKRKPHLDGGVLVARLLEGIRSNRLSLMERSIAATGVEAWRWKKNTALSLANAQLEIRMERAIARLLDEDWTNQIPAASGLTRAKEPRRSIDVVHRRKREEFDFIELKALAPGKTSRGDQTPLFGAMEILVYGLIFLYCKQDQAILYGDTASLRPVLLAERVHLELLATKNCYNHSEHRGQFSIEWLRSLIANGLEVLNRTQTDVHFDFAFKAFPDDFEWEIGRASCRERV